MREGRYRKLHCLIWNDDKFPYASDDCQLIFFHIYFNPLSTSFGLFKASIEALAADKKWSLKRYMKSFKESLANGFLKYDWKTSVVYFPNFLKYNPPQNPNILKGWSFWFKEIPNCELKVQWYQQLKSLVESLGESFKESFNKSFGESIGKTVSVTVSVTDTDKKKERHSFERPSVEEIKTYCQERKNTIDPQAFYDFYESKGWKVGNTPMKDWQAAVRTWEKRQPEKKPLPGYMRPPPRRTPGEQAWYEARKKQYEVNEAKRLAELTTQAKELAGKMKA